MPFSALVQAAEAISRGSELLKENADLLWKREHDYVAFYDSLSDNKSLDDTSNEGHLVENTELPLEETPMLEEDTDEERYLSEFNDYDDDSFQNTENSQGPTNIQNMTFDVKGNNENVMVDRKADNFLNDFEMQKLVEEELQKAKNIIVKEEKGDAKYDFTEIPRKNHVLTKPSEPLLAPNPFDSNDTQTLVRCNICKKLFINMKYLAKHLIAHEQDISTCHICGKVYRCSKSFSAHLKTHNKDFKKKEYKCQEKGCGKSFSSQFNLDYHNNVEHLGMKASFLCQECGKSFTTKFSLQQHLNIHKGLKPYSCQICGKSYSYQSALRDHQAVHGNEKKFVCAFPSCGKAFTQRSSLKAHKAIHKEKKDFICRNCGREFTQKQGLQRHMRAHKGERPFQCKLCNKLFGDPSIIRRHLQMVHKINKDVTSWREDVVEIQPVNEDGGDSNHGNETNDLSHLKQETEDTISEQKYRTAVKEPVTTVSKEGHGHYMPFLNLDGTEMDSSLIQSQLSIQKPNKPVVNLAMANSSSYQTQSTFSCLEQRLSQTQVNKTDFLPLQLISLSNSLMPGFVQNVDNVQLFTENLDGTFSSVNNQSISRRKSAEMLLNIPKQSVPVPVVVTSAMNHTGEQLKPDGTLAESQASHELEISPFTSLYPLLMAPSVSQYQAVQHL